MRFWALTGSEENWDKGISETIWGVVEGLKSQWDKIEKGDLLLFYATKPVSGIIGIGRVESKFKQDKPLWAKEIQENKVIWPYRFDFKVEYALPRSEWISKRVTSERVYRAGINSIINIEAVKSVLQRADSIWNTELNKILEEKITIRVPVKKEINLHNEIKDKLLELGKIERFIPEKEFVIPDINERLDVIWRRIAGSVPTYVFEIQIGGSLHQALAKLKHAYDIWNSNVFLIIDEKDLEKTNQLMSGTFHEIKDRMKIITVSKINRIYELQIEDNKLKIEAGLR
jgi:hypothetical protein